MLHVNKCILFRHSTEPCPSISMNLMFLNIVLPEKPSLTRVLNPEDRQCRASSLCKTTPDIRKRAAAAVSTDPTPSLLHSPSLIGHILQESVMFFTGSVSTNRELWKMWRELGELFFSVTCLSLRQMSTNPVTHTSWHPALKCSHKLHKGYRKWERD